MHTAVNESFIGFDIRIKGIRDNFLWVKEEHPFLQGLYVRDTEVWSSRFVDGWILQKDLQMNKYREPLQAENKIAVYTEYSQQYYLVHLWENLGNMIFRYGTDYSKDIVVGFSVFEITVPPPLTCHDLSVASTLEGKRFSNVALKDEFNVIKRYPEQWHFAGYDVGDLYGFNPFFLDIADALLDVMQLEQYDPWKNRNAYALFEKLEDAVLECRLANAYHDDCPYFVWGIYIAISPDRLTYTLEKS